MADLKTDDGRTMFDAFIQHDLIGHIDLTNPNEGRRISDLIDTFAIRYDRTLRQKFDRGLESNPKYWDNTWTDMLVLAMLENSRSFYHSCVIFTRPELDDLYCEAHDSEYNRMYHPFYDFDITETHPDTL